MTNIGKTFAARAGSVAANRFMPCAIFWTSTGQTSGQKV